MDSTEFQYRKIFRRMAKAYQRNRGHTWVLAPWDFVEWILRQPQERAWTPRTVRLYRAAISEFLSWEGNRGLAETVRQQLRPVRRKRAPRRTSAQGEKRLDQDDLQALVKRLNEERGKWDRTLLTWLFIELGTGLRPVEWREARIEGQWLEVKNAKYRPGYRAHGPDRRLDLSSLSPQERNLVFYLLDVIAEEGFDRTYRGCRHRLYRVTRQLFPGRKLYPNLYSLRHQFVSDRKKQGWSLVQLAAVLGHKADRTASAHYGKRQNGRSGGGSVQPDEEDKARVKRIHKSPPTFRDPEDPMEPGPG